MTQQGDTPAGSSGGADTESGGDQRGFWTRRRFLAALGVAGGAGAVVGGMEVLGLLPDAEEHKQTFVPPASPTSTCRAG